MLDCGLRLVCWLARSTASACSRHCAEFRWNPIPASVKRRRASSAGASTRLIIAKFVPGLSTIAPPMAGAMRIGWLRFIFLSALSAALWVGAALGTGMLFSSQIEELLQHLERIGSVAVAGALILLGGYIAFKWWERRRFFRELRMARISVSELYGLIQAGANPVIIDVRSPSARALEPHWIPGALHISLPDVGPHLKDLPRDRDIILYCTCPNEASAARVAKILMNHGFKRVRPLYGGLDAWRAAGYTVGHHALEHLITRSSGCWG